MLQAKGTFEVKVVAQPPDAGANETTLGRMLTAGTPNGSGVYVAIERVSGTLHGRKGSFVLHHTGIMTRGQPQMTISVVPDSGTDELAGISGSLSIEIVGGKHFYSFQYTLPETS